MDNKRLERIEYKIDHQDEHLGSIDVTLAKQHESIDHHIARTDALQVIVIALNRKITLAEGAIKLLGAAAVIAEIIRLFVK